MFSGLLSLLSGGLTGVLGVVVQRGFDAFNKAQDLKKMELQQKHLVELKRLDLEQADKEIARDIQISVTEAEARKDVAESQAFGESVWKEPDRYSKPSESGWLVFLDVVRGLVRPSLTVYLAAVVTIMYLEVKAMIELYSITMSPDRAFDVYETIINTVLYLFTTAVLWFFGTRNKGKQPGQK